MDIKRGELIQRTGASPRQIDYWCSHGIISTTGNNSPGSGAQREFNEEIIERVRTLVNISNAFRHRVPDGMLKQIYDRYEEGFLAFGNNIVLSWR